MSANLHRPWFRYGFSVITLFLLLFVPSAVASETNIRVYVDDKPVSFAVNPRSSGGTTLVQLRPLFDALNIEVKWDAATGTVQGKKGTHQFTLNTKSGKANINGKATTLKTPGQVVNGHTLVPLRFVGEASGATVGWNSASRMINIYSEEYVSQAGMTKQDAQQAANKGQGSTQGGSTSGNTSSTSPAASGLSGLYAAHSLDLLNANGCNGVCWDVLYFIDGKRVVTELPETGVDKLDCNKSTCLTYQFKGGKLTLSDGHSYKLVIQSNGNLTLDGEEYTRYKPQNRLVLEGTYRASGYTGQSSGGRGVTDTYVFRKDGTFVNRGWRGSTSDGSDNGGDGTGTSTTITGDSENSGTYSISGYTLTLRYKDGTQAQKMFFTSGKNQDFLRIGVGDYVLEEAIKPYQNKLAEDGMADKEVFKERTPNFKEQLGGIELGLVGYQWANITVKEAYKKNFSDFAGTGIIELTVKYTVTNNSKQAVNIHTLKNTVSLSGLKATLQETTALRPATANKLKPGARTEHLAVFLLPADRFDQVGSMEFSVANMIAANGQDLFKGESVDFSIFD